MGIDVHSLNFLRYVKIKKNIGSLITIGRQGIYITESELKEITKSKSEFQTNVYSEELFLNYLEASKVESIDNSEYEDATHIHDMNESIPQHLVKKYDTVFDGGCLEHIFNIPQALKNCSLFCKPGGQIIHILPANNQCGHGFWQFSPELFFSIYSKENGYSETEVFMANLSNKKKWFQVKKPENGNRVNIFSSNSLIVMVRTVLIGNEFRHSNVQQSDYIVAWNINKNIYGNMNNLSNSKPKRQIKIKQLIKTVPFVYDFLYQVLSPIVHLNRHRRRGENLNEKNPNLRKILVSDLLG